MTTMLSLFGEIIQTEEGMEKLKKKISNDTFFPQNSEEKMIQRVTEESRKVSAMKTNEKIYLIRTTDYDITEKGGVSRENTSFDIGLLGVRGNTGRSLLGICYEELWNAEILDSSISRYGKEVVFLELLKEMLFFGLSREIYEKNQKKFLESLARSYEESKRGITYFLQDVFENMGIEVPDHSDEYWEKEEEMNLVAKKKYKEERKALGLTEYGGMFG